MTTLSEKPLKLENLFTYIGSNISFTERDVNMRFEKAETATDKLLVIRKSDLSNKIKRDFFSILWLCQYYYTDPTHGRLRKLLRKSQLGIIQESSVLFF